jgi:hypothetical protein
MKIYIDENMPSQLADGLSILEKPNNEGVEVYSIQKEYGSGNLLFDPSGKKRIYLLGDGRKDHSQLAGNQTNSKKEQAPLRI